jgi:hypothetical protein
LIRQYVPKGTSMAKLTQQRCNTIARCAHMCSSSLQHRAGYASIGIAEIGGLDARPKLFMSFVKGFERSSTAIAPSRRIPGARGCAGQRRARNFNDHTFSAKSTLGKFELQSACS